MIGVKDISDAQLRWLYANCSGLVAVSHEDFGLTPLEANAFGKPVACLRAGGYVDTLKPGLSGVFIDTLSGPAIRSGIEELRRTAFDPARIVQHADRYSEAAFAGRLHELAEQSMVLPVVSSAHVTTLDLVQRDRRSTAATATAGVSGSTIRTADQPL